MNTDAIVLVGVGAGLELFGVGMLGWAIWRDHVRLGELALNDVEVPEPTARERAMASGEYVDLLADDYEPDPSVSEVRQQAQQASAQGVIQRYEGGRIQRYLEASGFPGFRLVATVTLIVGIILTAIGNAIALS